MLPATAYPFRGAEPGEFEHLGDLGTDALAVGMTDDEDRIADA
jgi:hypothetical protein